MARKLTKKDIEILRKLAPECEDTICSGSGFEYRSIIPPVSNHYAKDDKDFEKRLERLSAEELGYLSDLIIDGSESLSCVQPEHAWVFIETLARKLSNKLSDRIKLLYESCAVC
ncbi:MAG: hypothetical protein SV775_09685 [Thermodesulfobacteriota bacterium]|nr:hypothetical protein [Thermodesulfobacteriota bacterium]